MDQGEELGDEKDSDSNEIPSDIQVNHASQILNTFTFFVFIGLTRTSLNFRAARSLENFAA